MKTEEWIKIEKEFTEWDNETHSNASQRQIMDWFEVKFTQRESKYKELYGVQKDLIKFYGSIISDHAVFLKIHHVEETEGNIKLEEMFRQKIYSLEKELGL